jgi:N-carbamoyl-L-amino-acid hydrolase
MTQPRARQSAAPRGRFAGAAIDQRELLDDLEELARIGATGDGGVHRPAFSPIDFEAREWVEAKMRDLGMSVRRDEAANSIAALAGSKRQLPVLATGSHTDTVPHGGRYDGALGVVAGLACVRAIQRAGITLRHSLELINFAAEEATVAPGTFGSRAMAGLIAPENLRYTAWDGKPLADHLRRAGIDPDSLQQAARAAPSLAAYVELHIEQGTVLEERGAEIGIVEGIVGIRRYTATVKGVAAHAGTTPMQKRQDALVDAASFVLEVRRIGLEHEVTATVGNLVVSPGASNVVPGRVELFIDLRSLDERRLDVAEAELSDQIARRHGWLERISAKPPVQSSPRVIRCVREACSTLGFSATTLPSGAGHDAGPMACLAHQGMIFVPSEGGVSHSPHERTSALACHQGAEVLLHTLLLLDRSNLG